MGLYLKLLMKSGVCDTVSEFKRANQTLAGAPSHPEGGGKHFLLALARARARPLYQAGNFSRTGDHAAMLLIPDEWASCRRFSNRLFICPMESVYYGERMETIFADHQRTRPDVFWFGALTSFYGGGRTKYASFLEETRPS